MPVPDLIFTLRDSIVSLDEDLAEKTTEELITTNTDINEIIEKGITEAARIIGEKFESMEYFLGELLIAEEMITNSLNRFISVLPEGNRMGKKGTVVIATVYGDIHDIGKNLLAQMLKIHGFEVHDLGNNVPSIQIVNKAIETGADIISLSSLMSTTMPSQKEVIDMLTEFGNREKIKVIIGGGSTSPEWSESIKADGWGETVWDGVAMAKHIVGAE
ncbi:MAG: cobalamin B12-binding domain-containing protein [Promethearchaeota archaeon]|jgi:methylmalonyl-CoA mutase cobalamin-binding domain/chain